MAENCSSASSLENLSDNECDYTPSLEKMSDNRDNYEVLKKLTTYLLNSGCVCGCKKVTHIGGAVRSCDSCHEVWGVDDTTSYEQQLERLAQIAICKVCRKTTEAEEYFIFVNDKDALEILCMDCQTPCGMDPEDLKRQQWSSGGSRSSSFAEPTERFEREGTQAARRLRMLRTNSFVEGSSSLEVLRKVALEQIIPAAPQIGMSLGAAAGMLLFKNPRAGAIGGMIGKSVCTEVATRLKNVIE